MAFVSDEMTGILHIQEESAQQNTNIHQNASKRKAAASAESSDEESEDEGLQNHGNMQITLHIANQDEVVHFLKMRFTQIQQLATKVIAKAWIKAICPKKQANFPYVDSNPRADQSQKRRRPRHDGPPRIPLFWPDVELCRHKEPDHTRKTGVFLRMSTRYKSADRVQNVPTSWSICLGCTGLSKIGSNPTEMAQKFLRKSRTATGLVF
jgi:hypothetical protein